MHIRRRDGLALLGAGYMAAALSRDALLGAPPPVGPPLWLARRAGAKVYIFGVADAKDRSWLTPALEQAFHESQQVWFETPHPNPAANDLPPPSKILDIFKRDDQHSLFDVLPAALSARVLAAAHKYEVAREALEHERPWHAYFVLNRGYWAYRAKNGLGDMEESPDNVLAEMAWKSNKQVLAESPTYDDINLDFMGMSDQVAFEWLELLLDYLDDEEAGRLGDRFGWIAGRTSSRTLDRMRANQPSLYEYEHTRRNKTWGLRINNLLSFGGVYFVVLGMNHVLGPDSVLRNLKERGIAMNNLWQERPPTVT
jgi:uncharacterized protein YbaP (TraB family)